MNQLIYEVPAGKNSSDLMRKEMIFKSFDESVKSVHVGFFPAKGRYFIQEMFDKGDSCFVLEVMLPRGKSFYQYFFNGNFSAPKNNEQLVISQHDAQKRAPIMLENQVFCPVYFLNESSFINYIKDDIWEIQVITYQGWINEVELVTIDSVYPLCISFVNKNVAFWSCRIHADSRELNYCIKISGGGQIKFLSKAYHISEYPVRENFFSFNLQQEREKHNAIPFLRAGYQILPDRFHRVDVVPVEREFDPWGEKPANESYFGGNLKGISSKLEYIADLGIDFIYLNPIFAAKNSHRYDCSDYMLIDPVLGNEADLKELVDLAHQLGIKVIIDISLNHCSTDFFAFKDILIHQEQSIYTDWFEIEQFPLLDGNKHYYSCWHGHRELPQFNLNNQQVVEYFMQVARYWIGNFDIDGWRLDVCTEMPAEFVRKFAQESRKIKPEMVFIGETWQDHGHELAKNCEVNGITNFTLYLEGMIPLFEQEKLSLSNFGMTIMNTQSQNSFHTNLFSWNFLSNHDVPRFYSVLKSKDKYALAFTLIYALPGTPVIYYGEEICMEGLADPANRGCMSFEGSTMDSVLFKLIRNLNHIKKLYAEVFTYGSIMIPFVSDKDKLMVIKRSFADQHLYFVLNFNSIPQDYPMDCEIDGKNAGERQLVNIMPFSAKIIYYNKDSDGFGLFC